MADGKRDRSKVSLAWLAHWALMQDDEDPSFVGEYVKEAIEVVIRLGQHKGLSEADHQGLADLTVVLFALSASLDPNGPSRIFLRPEVRKSSEQGGRQRLSYEERLRRREAGAIAYRYYNTPPRPLKSTAIERAWEEMRFRGRAEGLSARIIERAMDHHRREIEASRSRQ